MKKTFTILIAAIAAIMLITQPMKVMGQTADYTYTLASVDFTTSTHTHTSGSLTWTHSHTSGTESYGWNDTYGFKFGFSNSSYPTAFKLTSSSVSNKIKKVVVTASVNSKKSCKLDVKVGSTTYGSQVTINTKNNDAFEFSIADASTVNGAVELSFSSNTGPLYLKKIEIYYYSGGGSTVNTPQIIPNGGSFYPTQSVELSCTTDGASIYYTTDGTAPSVSSTPYSSAFTINNTCTVKAIATKSGMTNSSVAEATFTKITPYANIAALTAQTVTGTYYVTFTNATVTYTNGNFAYIQDASGAVVLYKSGHGYTAGDVLNGTATVSYKLQNNNPQITELSGVTKESGDAPEPTTVAASDWNYTFNNVLNKYIKITDATLTYTSSKHHVTLGSDDVVFYGLDEASSVNGNSLDLTTVYTLVGFPTLYNSTKELQMFVMPVAAGINIENSALQLSYSANASGSIAVSYSNYTPTTVATGLYSDAACTSSFSGDWISLGSMTTPFTSIAYDVSENTGASDRTVYMKVTASNGKSTFNKKFTITQVFHQTYSVTYKANGGTGDDVVDSGYDYNTTVTVKPNNGTGTNPGFSKAGYTFQNWNTNAGGTGTTYIPSDNEHNTFNITANTNLFAQWQANTYDLHTAAMTNGSVSFKVNNADATTANTDQTVTIVVTPASGYKLSTITVTNDATSATVTVTNNTFTMPASSITVSATFEVYYALTIDFESNDLSTYSNWSFSDIAIASSITAYGGTYYGTNNGKTSSTITTTSKIASPGKIIFYVRRTSNNTNTAFWKVYTKTQDGAWTQRGDSQDATAENWTKCEIDLSSYSNVYVKIEYGGNTAVRAIDDIALEYTPTEYAVSVSNVDNGTISATEGSTTITEGNSSNIESGRTVNLTAEGDATHMFSSWSVSGATVADASSATTTFEMPANAVTVSATFVESWTFTYNINGNVVSEKYAKNGATITLPTTSEYVPEGYSIIGWTETEGNVASPITSATASQNRTLYAVFGKIVYDDFVKITSSNTPSDWTGYYLIVYEKTDANKAFNSGLATLDANNNIIPVSISNGSIAFNNTTKAAMVTIASNGTNKYSIKAANGSYIGATASGNLNTTTTSTEYQHELSISNGVTIVKCGSVYLQYNASATRYRYYTSGQQAIQLYKASSSIEGAYTHIYPSNATATGDINVSTSGPIVIESGGILDMGSHTLACTDATKLIIEDGGQLITTNAVSATIKKNITAGVVESKGDAQYWYAISSPVNATSATITANTNLITGTTTPNRYDLYRYNETAASWENYKAHNGVGGDFLKLENGRGYLYRNESDLTITFTGMVNTTASYTVTAGGPTGYTGFNLIGNPYTHEIYKGGAFANSVTEGYELATGFYKLNPATGGWVAATDGETPIAPNDGFLVQATTGGTITIDNTAAKTRYNNEYLQFTVANSEYEDVAYAWFDKGTGLRKINHRNADIPMLFINQEGNDYAIATMSDNIKSFNLNFKASNMGKYTLSYKANGEFTYLHIIDRLTGADVDMLLDGEYSFVATQSDSENRFIVRLEYLPNYSDESNDIFAYQYGNDILVAGEGELQIFDVTGRNVMTTTINGAESINFSAKGVYILRLVGNEVKTQKIVVR